MSIIRGLKNLLSTGGNGGSAANSNDDRKKQKALKNLKRVEDPLDKWDIFSHIGDGAFSKVYKAQQKRSGLEAALKQVEISDEAQLEDYSVEISILLECKHENIVMLHDSYLYDGKLWMFLEFCGGGAVDSIMLNLERALNEAQIKSVCREMCRGLEFLHQNNIIHRDLKAGNVLLTITGQVKLADFGVSARNENNRQQRNTFIGTPYWMAPEVITCETIKNQFYDYKADIWSLGITLIEFSQMEPPNHEIHPARVILKIQKSDPPTLMKPSSWSKEFNEIIAKCLVKDPSRRLSATELLQNPFLTGVVDNLAVKQLLREVTAEVTVEEVVDDTDVEVSSINDSGSTDLDIMPISPVSPEIKIDFKLADGYATELLDAIIEDVLLSNHKEPSIPSVVLASIMDTINNIPDFNSLERTQALVLSGEEFEKAVAILVEEIINEVILSTSRKPSAASVVLEVIMEFINGPGGQKSAQNGTPSGLVASLETKQAAKEAAEIRSSYKKTLTKTRKFVDSDGRTVTTKTLVVIEPGEETKQAERDIRNADLRELKQQQKLESRQLQEFDAKAFSIQNELLAKFEKDKQNLLKIYENEADTFGRQMKLRIDKVQEKHAFDTKALMKKLKLDQERELKQFQEAQKQEMKTFKSGKKKDFLRQKKEEKQMEQTEKERKFIEEQQRNYEIALQRFADQQRQNVAMLERQILEQQQQQARVREGGLWELEEVQLSNRQMLLRRQLKDRLILQRHQILMKHEQEAIQMNRFNQHLVDQMLNRHVVEKKRLPKLLKAESKQRIETLKKALRSGKSKMTLEQFEEEEKRKTKDDQEKVEMKMKQEWNKLQAERQLRLKETELTQAGKLKILVDQEAEEVQELDVKCAAEMNDWRSELSLRKQKLEEEFQLQLNTQQNFYSSTAGVSSPVETAAGSL